MLDGVTVSESKAQKDELILEGIDVQNVSQSGASIRESCLFSATDSPLVYSCIDPGRLPGTEQGYP